MLKLPVLLACHAVLQGMRDEALRKSNQVVKQHDPKRFSASGYGSTVYDLVKTTRSQSPKQKRQSKPVTTRRGEPCDQFVLLLLLRSLTIRFSLGLHSIRLIFIILGT